MSESSTGPDSSAEAKLAATTAAAGPAAADRRSTASAEASGRRDQREERHFEQIIGTPFKLHEMHQPEMKTEGNP